MYIRLLSWSLPPRERGLKWQDANSRETISRRSPRGRAEKRSSLCVHKEDLFSIFTFAYLIACLSKHSRLSKRIFRHCHR